MATVTRSLCIYEAWIEKDGSGNPVPRSRQIKRVNVETDGTVDSARKVALAKTFELTGQRGTVSFDPSGLVHVTVRRG